MLRATLQTVQSVQTVQTVQCSSVRVVPGDLTSLANNAADWPGAAVSGPRGPAAFYCSLSSGLARENVWLRRP